MTYTDSVTGSAGVARSLLAAWDSGDLPRLKDELRQIAEVDASKLSRSEFERIEIVQGVAQTIQGWLRGAKRKHEDLEVGLRLLRHLMTQGMRMDLRTPGGASGYRSPMTTSLAVPEVALSGSPASGRY
jgi:hypothetical protein